MFLSAGEIVCTGRLLVADEECFIGAISPNDYLPYGSRGQRCTWRIQVRRLPGRAFKRIVSRRRFEEQATSDQRHAWSLGNASPLLCVLVYDRRACRWLLHLLAHGLGVARGITSSFRCGRVDRAGSIPSRHSSAVKVFRTIERELPSIAVVMRRHV